MGRTKGSKNKANLGNAGERIGNDKYKEDKPMTVAAKEEILELAKTMSIKEISGRVGFDMVWIAHVIDALMPDITKKMELTKNFIK